MEPTSQQYATTPDNPVPRPAFRRLRGYAFDPSLSLQMDTALVNGIVFKLPWDETPERKLEKGPVGEYLEVIDYDPASGCFYEPVDLNNPHVLGQDGLPPSEGNPQFHQQMVYAVAMTTIGNFERALGRPALWAPFRPEVRAQAPVVPKPDAGGPAATAGSPPLDRFVARLRIYPHALRDANAFYSPAKKALLFGYFPAPESTEERAEGLAHVPGGWVFTCLSHDVIAHETSHALLDGMHRRYIEPTHPDSLAFHEAFADIVALFQHFSFPEVLRHQIGRTRGDLTTQNLLGQLAQQFGRALGQHGALRDAIGRFDEVSKVWKPHAADPTALTTTFEAHDRGAILVAAVFDAFQAIYRRRVEDLYRIATSGTGVLPDGELHPDLVNRLASEAAKAATHVLQMCIRALDYCPPLDITFGDYLRAIITADSDLIPDDDLGYRVAFIEAFRRRGIYPRNVRTLSMDSLRWPYVMRSKESSRIENLTEVLRQDLAKLRDSVATRKAYFERSQDLAEKLHVLMSRRLSTELEALIDRCVCLTEAVAGVPSKDGRPVFEVHSVRDAQRIGPDGDKVNHVVVVITQRRMVRLDASDQTSEEFPFRGGCTLIFDLDTFKLLYAIGKGIDDEDRLARQREYMTSGRIGDLWSTYFGKRYLARPEEPFAILHRSVEELQP
jgi:hypothetical protein